MVKRILTRLRRTLGKVSTAAATTSVDVAAAIWGARAGLLEAAGGAALVVAAASVASGLAWLTVGACLVVKAAEIDRRQR